MNKSIKIGIIVIISIVVLSVVCFTLVEVGKSNYEDYKKDQEIEAKREQEKDVKHILWINSVNWGPKNENLNNNEFGISFPFKLEDLDKFNVSCGWNDSPKSPTITEWITSNDILEWDDPKKSFEHCTRGTLVESKSEYKFDETLGKYINYNPFHLAEFNIYNLSDSEATVNDCYKKGWWKIEQDGRLDIAFAMEDPDDEYHKDRYTKPLLNTIAKKMGKPTYIICYPIQSTPEDMDNNEGSFRYQLVYEYDNFVIHADFYESYFKESNFDQYGPVNLVYCPKEYWEQTKPTEQDYIKTIDKNGVPIYFVESL